MRTVLLPQCKNSAVQESPNLNGVCCVKSRLLLPVRLSISIPAAMENNTRHRKLLSERSKILRKTYAFGVSYSLVVSAWTGCSSLHKSVTRRAPR